MGFHYGKIHETQRHEKGEKKHEGNEKKSHEKECDCQGQAREEFGISWNEGEDERRFEEGGLEEEQGRSRRAHQRRSEKRCAHQEQERKDCEQEDELAGQGYLQEERHCEVECSDDAGAKGPRNRRVVQRRGPEREGTVGEDEVLLQQVSVSRGTSLRGYTLPLLLLSRPSPLGREGAGERGDGFVRQDVSAT